MNLQDAARIKKEILAQFPAICAVFYQGWIVALRDMGKSEAEAVAIVKKHVEEDPYFLAGCTLNMAETVLSAGVGERIMFKDSKDDD